MLCDSAMAVDMAMVSRENSDSSMPGWPCVTPSHMAGTPPANWATAPTSRTASLITFGKYSNGWCADSMSLYEDTIATDGCLYSRSLSLSLAGKAAKPCARFVHDSALRCTPLMRAASRCAR